jgi:hemolysin activation/secretion protein
VCIAVAVLSMSGTALAQSAPATAELPSFEELEAAGAIIGRIVVNPQDIFDLDDPRENTRLFRLANRLHIQTRPEVIRRQLLFKPGERVSARLIDETERLLRRNRYLHDVSIRPVDYRDGVVDIEVKTRDSWTLDPGVSIARAGGSSSQRIYLNEHNLLGTGIGVGLTRSSNVERAGTEISVRNDQLFGTRGTLAASYANLIDGSQWAFALARPFYSLDARYAAGISAANADVVNKVYEQGVVVSQYHALTRNWEAFGGWSAGSVHGWAARYSAGLTSTSSTYQNDPALPTAGLPADRTLAGPFIRYELIEDFYEKVQNREQIGRPEYFAMGFRSQLQLGRTVEILDSTEESWVYSVTASKGFGSIHTRALLLSGVYSGRWHEATRRNQLLSGTAKFYWPHGRAALFSATFSGDMYRHPDTPAPLQLGGDTGLRGYPLNYQSGERRALVTLEERLYSDWYPYRLYRIGGAVFTDFGRAWHGEGEVSAGERMLSDAGIGLRIADARSALGTVLHVDLAFPLNARDQVKSVQLLFKSQTSF